MKTRLTALLLLLAVALPSASLAQSAGDDQYVDPFQGEQGGSEGDRSESGSDDDGGGMPLGVALGGTAVLAAGLVAGGIVLKRRGGDQPD